MNFAIFSFSLLVDFMSLLRPYALEINSHFRVKDQLRGRHGDAEERNWEVVWNSKQIDIKTKFLCRWQDELSKKHLVASDKSRRNMSKSHFVQSNRIYKSKRCKHETMGSLSVCENGGRPESDFYKKRSNFQILDIKHECICDSDFHCFASKW